MTRDDTLTTIEIFPWNPNFETGIDKIDEQHKKLVDLINRLAMHLANRSSETELNRTFDELADYADYHFRSEEGVWSQFLENDPAYGSHLTTHHSFIDDVLLLKENGNGRVLDDVIYDIVAFLSKWLAYHILDTDKRMAETVLAMKAGASLEEAKALADQHMSGSKKVLINTVLSMYETLSTSTLNLMREKALRRQAEEALSRSEERWRFVLEGGIEDVWDWDMVKNRVSHSENELPLFEIIGKELQPNSEISIHPGDIEAMKRDFDAHLAGNTEFYTSKYRVLRKNGSWSWFLSRGKVVSRDAEGSPLRMIGTHSDITEKKLASEILRNSSQGIFICDMNNKIISINPAFTAITGYTLEDVAGRDPKIFSSGRHDQDFFQEMWRSILSTGHWRGEIYNRRKNAEVYPELLMINTVKDAQGNIDHYFAIFDDISEKKKADELIFEQANYNALTKLPNRQMFFDRLEQEMRHSHRSGSVCALLFVDLDHFKDVNDTLGHEVGDSLLLEASGRLVEATRETDTVGHLGGDNFTVIVTDLNGSVGLEGVTQGIIDRLSRPYRVGEHSTHLSASVGIALYPHDADDAVTLLKHAEQAMYLAKKSGRSCYEYFTPSMQEEAQKRRHLLNDLHKALEAGEFEIHYQPIVDLKTGVIRKAEALIRWRHPEHGLIPPDEFIPLAEESGLIVEIGDWVYREATRRNKRWQEQYDPAFQVSINKSAVQFRTTGTVNKWIEHLEEIGLFKGNNVIEITESILMEHEGRVAEKLKQLRDEGIEISLDDFGTGYSSLAYLQKFEIDFVKIDKSFVGNLNAESVRETTLCEAIVTMAHKLDIRVIAEGVETPFQLELLAKMQCDYAQGYLFSRPVPADAFEALLEQGPFPMVQ